MKTEDQKQMVFTLLDLVWQLEQTLKDYSRQLSAHDDGHWLEQDSPEDPF